MYILSLGGIVSIRSSSHVVLSKFSISVLTFCLLVLLRDACQDLVIGDLSVSPYNAVGPFLNVR